jgi:hypothetical protein
MKSANSTPVLEAPFTQYSAPTPYRTDIQGPGGAKATAAGGSSGGKKKSGGERVGVGLGTVMGIFGAVGFGML